MIEDPYRAHVRVSDDEAVVLVDGHAVGTAAARELYLHAHAGHRAVGCERHAPHRVGARGGDEQRVFFRIEHQPVRARHTVGELVQRAARRIAVHAAGRIGEVALPLVGEIQIAVGGKREIVDALEVLAMVTRDERRDRAARGIEQHDAEFVIGDEDAAVLVNAQPVRLAVVLGDNLEPAVRRDAEDAAVRDIDHVQVAGAVERRSFEKAAGGNGAAARGDTFGRHVGLAQRLRHGGEYFGLDQLRRREHGVVVFAGW